MAEVIIPPTLRGAHRAGHAPRDAPFEGAAIEPAVGAAPVGAGAAERRAFPFLGRALPRLVGQRWYATVRRIDHQRGSRRGHPGAAIPPEIVVGARHIGDAAALAILVAARFLGAFFEGRDFLAREEFPALDIRRPLEWRNGLVRVGALQVGFPPGRARGSPVLRGRSRTGLWRRGCRLSGRGDRRQQGHHARCRECHAGEQHENRRGRRERRERRIVCDLCERRD